MKKLPLLLTRIAEEVEDRRSSSPAKAKDESEKGDVERNKRASEKEGEDFAGTRASVKQGRDQ